MSSIWRRPSRSSNSGSIAHSRPSAAPVRDRLTRDRTPRSSMTAGAHVETRLRRRSARRCAPWSRRARRPAQLSARSRCPNRDRASCSSASRRPACAALTCTSSAGTRGQQENFGPPPMIFGHEMAGTVVARGPGATRVADRRDGRRRDALRRLDVLPVPHGPRPRVPEHAHPRRARPGSFAEYVAIPEVNAWVVEGLAPEIAALQEPLGNAVHAAFVEDVAGQTAVVTGCGPIGLMSIAVLKMAGASRRVRDGPQRGAARAGARRWAPTWRSTLATTSSAGSAPRPTATASTSCSRCRDRQRRCTRAWRCGDQRRPRVAARNAHRCRRRSTCRRRSSSRASASTASPAGGCGTRGIGRRRCSRRASTSLRSSATACRSSEYAQAFDLVASGPRR